MFFLLSLWLGSRPCDQQFGPPAVGALPLTMQAPCLILVLALGEEKVAIGQKLGQDAPQFFYLTGSALNHDRLLPLPFHLEGLIHGCLPVIRFNLG